MKLKKYANRESYDPNGINASEPTSGPFAEQKLNRRSI